MKHWNASSFATLPIERQKAALAALTTEQLAELAHDWTWWARPEQLAPEGRWNAWTYIAGRGAGKTRTGAEWVRSRIKAGCMYGALVAPTARDARKVMIEGESGLLSVCWEGDKGPNGAPLGRPIYEPSKTQVVWPNGAIVSLFSAEEPDRLRGPQFEFAWCDEMAAWARLEETWDMLQFGLRLGRHPQAMVTTTPRPVPVLRRLMSDPATVVSRGSTFDNAANLAPSFVAAIRERYENTRLGRQELYAEILDDMPGALWTRAALDECRVKTAPEMRRVVVAVDPSGQRGDGEGDSIGIVVAGVGVDGRGYVLADRTCDMSPAGWGRRAVEAYHEFRADRIVAERNFGGAMVEHVIRTTDRNVAYREVTASRGKVARAEPVAALYEQGRISHFGGMPEMEDQMCAFGPSGYAGGGSPDRVDALVWALSDLMLTGREFQVW